MNNLLHFENGLFVSYPENWAAFFNSVDRMSSEELSKLAESPRGGVYSEQYVAGDCQLWLKSNERKVGDRYWAVNRYWAALDKRKYKEMREEMEKWNTENNNVLN